MHYGKSKILERSRSDTGAERPIRLAWLTASISLAPVSLPLIHITAVYKVRFIKETSPASGKKNRTEQIINDREINERVLILPALLVHSRLRPSAPP